MTDNDITEVPETFKVGDLLVRADRIYFVDLITAQIGDRQNLVLRRAGNGVEEERTSSDRYAIDGWERIPVADERVDKALHQLATRARSWKEANVRTEQQYRDVRSELEIFRTKVSEKLMELGTEEDVADQVAELLDELGLKAERRVTITGTFSVTMTAPYKWQSENDVDDDDAVFDEMTSNDITITGIEF